MEPNTKQRKNSKAKSKHWLLENPSIHLDGKAWIIIFIKGTMTDVYMGFYSGYK